jgi:hypothetical protein
MGAQNKLSPAHPTSVRMNPEQLARIATAAKATDSAAPCIFAGSFSNKPEPATNTRCHAKPRTMSKYRNAQYGIWSAVVLVLPAVLTLLLLVVVPLIPLLPSGTNTYVAKDTRANKAIPSPATKSAPNKFTKSPVPNSPGANIQSRCIRSAFVERSNEYPPSSSPVMAIGAADITRNIAVHAHDTHTVPFLAFGEFLNNEKRVGVFAVATSLMSSDS